jgi:hypothetical protein
MLRPPLTLMPCHRPRLRLQACVLWDLQLLVSVPHYATRQLPLLILNWRTSDVGLPSAWWLGHAPRCAELLLDHQKLKK